MTLLEEIFVLGCSKKRQKMKILFHGSCFRTNQVLVGRDVSTLEICMSGLLCIIPLEITRENNKKSKFR
jgi:hypothetical protein